MPQFAAISRERHANKAWRRYTDYHFAARETLLPLVIAELSRAAVNMPTALISQEDGFKLVAVTALAPGKNLFVAPSGQWLGNYVPAVLRGYPFRLIRPQNAQDPVLCIDEDSGLLTEDDDGESFFDAQGNPTELVKQIMDFLAQVEHSRVATDLAVAAIAEAGLIEPWPMKLKKDGQEVEVTGLHRVSEAKFHALDDEAFIKLRHAGALSIAVLQMVSMQQIMVFDRLAQLQERLNQNKGSQSVDLDNVFGNDQSGTLRFDFQ